MISHRKYKIFKPFHNQNQEELSIKLRKLMIQKKYTTIPTAIAISKNNYLDKYHRKYLTKRQKEQETIHFGLFKRYSMKEYQQIGQKNIQGEQQQTQNGFYMKKLQNWKKVLLNQNNKDVKMNISLSIQKQQKIKQKSSNKYNFTQKTKSGRWMNPSKSERIKMIDNNSNMRKLRSKIQFNSLSTLMDTQTISHLSPYIKSIQPINKEEWKQSLKRSKTSDSHRKSYPKSNSAWFKPKIKPIQSTLCRPWSAQKQQHTLQLHNYLYK